MTEPHPIYDKEGHTIGMLDITDYQVPDELHVKFDVEEAVYKLESEEAR